MTDENIDAEYNPETDPDADADLDDDVTAALEGAGYVEKPDPTDESDDGEESAGGRASGLLGKITDLSGSGKSLDAYEDDPIASVFDTDGDETHKGAKHIARGFDGLSPVAAMNPLVDIAVGFILISADSETDGGLFGGSADESEESAYESEDGGDMLT